MRCSTALLPCGGMAQLCPWKRQSLVMRDSLQAAKEIRNRSIIGMHGRQGRSVSKQYFVKDNAVRDKRRQRRQGHGGSNDACFQAIVVAPAGCCCTSHCHICCPIADGRIWDNGERVVVVPIEGGVLGDVCVCVCV
jgi:hypothetical protein